VMVFIYIITVSAAMFIVVAWTEFQNRINFIQLCTTARRNILSSIYIIYQFSLVV